MRWDIPPIRWWEAEHVGDRWRGEVARGEVRPTWLDPGDGGEDDLDPGDGGEDDDIDNDVGGDDCDGDHEDEADVD